jgi:DNA invertase Pin-like site-specific DNA recombinase
LSKTPILLSAHKLVELFDEHGVSFVSVTQSFNTTSSMGRLALDVLLSFARFEREVAGEPIRDKIAASKKRGLWVGGIAPLRYEVRDKKLGLRRFWADRASARRDFVPSRARCEPVSTRNNASGDGKGILAAETGGGFGGPESLRRHYACKNCNR